MYPLKTKTHKEELRCVIAVIRHGDRSPKQKIKVKVEYKEMIDFYARHSETPKKDLKVKAKKPMIEFLQVIKDLITKIELEHDERLTPPSAKEKKEHYKLVHMRDILEVSERALWDDTVQFNSFGSPYILTRRSGGRSPG